MATEGVGGERGSFVDVCRELLSNTWAAGEKARKCTKGAVEASTTGQSEAGVSLSLMNERGQVGVDRVLRVKTISFC